ncbi:cytochrome P450 [Streptomyces tateyamensis]|uniref:cytochrome P450 n=1 Tax=Streptomyces tateyamensis TaxID=565073 RepID=UPI001FEAFE35|nr:cytochrome P450 [Streptomyces tateyamensis]
MDQVDVDRIFRPQTYAVGVPYELFAQLRAARAVWWVREPAVGAWPAGPGYWAVLRHAEVKQVLRTPGVFSSYLGATQIRDPDSSADLEFARTMMLNQDPPEHARLRRIVAAAFTPRALGELSAAIEECARELVNSVREVGQADFVRLAAELPVRVLARVLGVPEQDRQLLVDWSNRVIGYQDADYADSCTVDPASLTELGRTALAARPATRTTPDGRPVNPRSRAALADMFAYAHGLAVNPRPGSLLARMREGGLSTQEFETAFFLFAVAGNETVRNGLPGGLLSLLSHPAQHRLLLAQPELLGSAVEEMLRFWPPVVSFRRTATCEVDLGGVRIGRGQKVVVYHAAANRDGAVFRDPDRFDLTRTPNDHVSFGFGPHFCLGAQLARMQYRAMIRAMLELPGLEPATGAPPGRLVSNFQNGLKELPVRWAPNRSTRTASTPT